MVELALDRCRTAALVVSVEPCLSPVTAGCHGPWRNGDRDLDGRAMAGRDSARPRSLADEDRDDERAREAAQPKVAPVPSMTPEETDAALAFLKDAKLAERIVGDFERVGLVGEPRNALVAYLACISRKLAAPLAVLIQSTSAAGKSANRR
jgi:hypothetical protein